jgi:hypothetical protein
MDGPAIKGTAMESVVTDTRRLLEEGRVARDELEARLEAQDLRLLEEKIFPAAWYPIDSYRRLSELLMHVEGGGDPQYLVRRGARAAERLFASGIYLQLKRGEERAQEARQTDDGWTELDGNLIVSIAGAIFNVGRWRFEMGSDDPPTYRIEVTEAEALPEVARHAAHGFVEYCASRLLGAPIRVSSDRIGRECILYRFGPG